MRGVGLLGHGDYILPAAFIPDAPAIPNNVELGVEQPTTIVRDHVDDIAYLPWFQRQTSSVLPTRENGSEEAMPSPKSLYDWSFPSF